MKRFVLSLILILTAWLPQHAYASNGLPTVLSHSAEISILYAEPSSDDVYTLYGHTGLRVSDVEQGLDVTFNYGIFSFTDDFLLRFIKGQTDYMVLAQPTPIYMEEYLSVGRNVTELVLRMDDEQRQWAWNYLLNNIKPENRIYRYNFFYDNCSTRMLDIFVEALKRRGGYRIEFALPYFANEKETWRDAINQLESPYPWIVLGTDLLLGSPTDSMMTAKDRAFLPTKLEALLNASKLICADGQEKKPLLRVRHYYANKSNEETDVLMDALTHPLFAFVVLLLPLLYLAYQGLYLNNSLGRGLDAVYFALTGLVGCLVFYIACLSEHPHVSPNFNLMVFHPLHLLLGAPLMLVPSARRYAYAYHTINLIVLTVFFSIAPLLIQSFNIAVYVLALGLWLLSLTRIIEWRRCHA